MNEASFASLSPTLLARKGGAKPAMRPQHGGQIGADFSGSAAAKNLEDLGWDDMGDEPEVRHQAEIVHLTPPAQNPQAVAAADKPQIHQQQDELAQRLEANDTAPAAAKPAKSPRRRKSAIDRGERAAFTLRLDAKRHLKLRLACTVRNRSAQQIVTDALDALLEKMPEIESLAAQVKQPKPAPKPANAE